MMHLLIIWHEFISKAKALPLKFVVDNKYYSLESVAKEVKATALDKKDFALPAEAKIVKSPY